MNLEAEIGRAKEIAIGETIGYKANAKNLVVNAAKAAVGLGLAWYFDDAILELVFGGYGVMKGIHCWMDYTARKEGGDD